MKVPKFTGRKLDAAERAARKQARTDAAAANGSGNNVAALRARIDRIEQILGIVPATTKEPVR